jgi:hypothetical protein
LTLLATAESSTACPVLRVVRSPAQPNIATLKMRQSTRCIYRVFFCIPFPSFLIHFLSAPCVTCRCCFGRKVEQLLCHVQPASTSWGAPPDITPHGVGRCGQQCPWLGSRYIFQDGKVYQPLSHFDRVSVHQNTFESRAMDVALLS